MNIAHYIQKIGDDHGHCDGEKGGEENRRERREGRVNTIWIFLFYYIQVLASKIVFPY